MLFRAVFHAVFLMQRQQTLSASTVSCGGGPVISAAACVWDICQAGALGHWPSECASGLGPDWDAFLLHEHQYPDLQDPVIKR